jgi:hypothetical protein
MQQADILDKGFDEGAAALKWDQFEENERKFGIILDGYNESEYTVPLDTNSPDFEERKRRAEALALEIRNGRTGCRNVHIREELDLPPIGETVDEETLYSTVNAPSDANLLRLGLRADQVNVGVKAVSEEHEVLEETADSEGPVEDWKLDQDAPEYEPLEGGLAALPYEVKELLPVIADMLAPSLQRILVDAGLVPPCVLEDNRDHVASVDYDDDTQFASGGEVGPPGTSDDMLDGGSHLTRLAGGPDRPWQRSGPAAAHPRPVHQVGSLRRPQATRSAAGSPSQQAPPPQPDWRHDGGRPCAAGPAASNAAVGVGGDAGLATTGGGDAAMSGGPGPGRMSWASIVRAAAAAGAATGAAATALSQ